MLEQFFGKYRVVTRNSVEDADNVTVSELNHFLQLFFNTVFVIKDFCTKSFDCLGRTRRARGKDFIARCSQKLDSERSDAACSTKNNSPFFLLRRKILRIDQLNFEALEDAERSCFDPDTQG